MSPDLAEHLRELLSTLILEHNYQSPIFVTAIGANGSLIYARYTASTDGPGFLDCEMLLEHSEDSGLRSPVRVLYLDTATARLAMVTIESEKQRTYTIQ